MELSTALRSAAELVRSSGRTHDDVTNDLWDSFQFSQTQIIDLARKFFAGSLSLACTHPAKNQQERVTISYLAQHVDVSQQHEVVDAEYEIDESEPEMITADVTILSHTTYVVCGVSKCLDDFTIQDCLTKGESFQLAAEGNLNRKHVLDWLANQLTVNNVAIARELPNQVRAEFAARWTEAVVKPEDNESTTATTTAIPSIQVQNAQPNVN